MNEDRLTIRDGDVDTDLIAEYEATRRDAVRRGLIAGGAVVSAAMIPALLKVRQAVAQAGDDPTAGDAGIVEGAVGLEQTAVVAYTAAGGFPELKSVADLFKAQEQEHADALIAALEGLGGTAPPPPKVEDVAGLSQVKDANGALNFAVELENMAVAAYVDAGKMLQSADLQKSAAQIVSNEGQHLVVLRQALGSNPVPSAFPSGSEKG